MKTVKTEVFYGLLGGVVFTILLGKCSLGGIVFGCVLGVVFSLILAKIQKCDSGVFLQSWSLRYYILLLKDMFLSTVQLCKTVFRKTIPNHKIVKLKTNTSQKGKILVSNSISLTPGTVTIEHEKEDYRVLYLQMSKNPEDMYKVAEVFEKRILESVNEQEVQ